jgi:N-acetylneuraminic acid mutarotase
MASGVYAPNVDKLFVFGGDRTDTGTYVDTTRIYDIATNTWSTGAKMPDVRSFMASGYYNGKIYLVAGYNASGVTAAQAQVWQYDPITNTFNTTRMNHPHALGGPGFGIINGHLYTVGGRDASNTVVNLVYDYDIAADTWTQRANVPTAINVPGSAVVAGKLWVFGGGNPFVNSGTLPKSNQKGVLIPDTTNILQIYDPTTDTWTSGPTLNQLRAFPAGRNVGNTAVAVGGRNGSVTTTSVEINVTTGECTATPTVTATATATATATPTATPTPTIRPTPTARPNITPRSRPTPPPRP